MTEGPPAAIGRRLGQRPGRIIAPDPDALRAAVALVLRPGRPAEELAAGPSAQGSDLEVLFVVRAHVEGDPWSGHVALPGGRVEPDDGDLIDTALRELVEETGLGLARSDVIGRLDDLRPVSREIPPILISPFVAWHGGDTRVRRSHEIRDHFWAPLPELTAPERSTVLVHRRRGRERAFQALSFGEHTVWGLTFEIIQNFLGLLEERG